MGLIERFFYIQISTPYFLCVLPACRQAGVVYSACPVAVRLYGVSSVVAVFSNFLIWSSDCNFWINSSISPSKMVSNL